MNQEGFHSTWDSPNGRSKGKGVVVLAGVGNPTNVAGYRELYSISERFPRGLLQFVYEVQGRR